MQFFISMAKVNLFSFKHVLVSLNNQTVTECHNHIQNLIRLSLLALSSLLDELAVHKILTYDHAFEEYAGKIAWVANAKNRRVAKITFRSVILAKNGIPVVICENKGQR